MQLHPIYGRAIVVAIPDLADPATPLLRQRERLAGIVAGLDAGQWATPSRCEGWTVQDVITHLVTTNQFWAFSIDAGLKGAPTEFLSTFDPVASPAELVRAAGSCPPEDTLAQFVGTNEALAATIGRVDGSWSVIAEAPPGHLATSLVAQHALWDSWVHERDIVLPLGMEPAVEPDEVDACIRYAVALSPAFLVGTGSTRRAVIEVDVTDPDVHVHVDVGSQVVIHDGRSAGRAIVLTGDAVQVLEALSHRGPFPRPLGPDDRWVLDGLAHAFDTTM